MTIEYFCCGACTDFSTTYSLPVGYHQDVTTLCLRFVRLLCLLVLSNLFSYERYWSELAER